MDPFMALWVFFIGTLVGFLAGIVIIYRGVAVPLKAEKRAVEKTHRQMAAVYGKTTEQFAPFMEAYPFDPKRFRFIGTPVDGVQFNEDGVVFVEFKSASGSLSTDQRRIKDLVEQKKVSWLTFEVAWESH
jgi:predicted Holliday junction resolvase-like endonuclease